MNKRNVILIGLAFLVGLSGYAVAALITFNSSANAKQAEADHNAIVEQLGDEIDALQDTNDTLNSDLEQASSALEEANTAMADLTEEEAVLHLKRALGARLMPLRAWRQFGGTVLPG